MLTTKIEELTKSVEGKEAQITEIEEQLKEAGENREKENKEYLVAKKDSRVRVIHVLVAGERASEREKEIKSQDTET